jgi:hypothetical protein
LTHNSEDVQALIDATAFIKPDKDGKSNTEWDRFFAARELLCPKPERGELNDEKHYNRFVDLCGRFHRDEITAQNFWSELVILTMRPVQKQKYHMPHWRDLEKTCDNGMAYHYAYTPRHVIYDRDYGFLRHSILLMNDKIP